MTVRADSLLSFISSPLTRNHGYRHSILPVRSSRLRLIRKLPHRLPNRALLAMSIVQILTNSPKNQKVRRARGVYAQMLIASKFGNYASMLMQQLVRASRYGCRYGISNIEYLASASDPATHAEPSSIQQIGGLPSLLGRAALLSILHEPSDFLQLVWQHRRATRSRPIRVAARRRGPRRGERCGHRPTVYGATRLPRILHELRTPKKATHRAEGPAVPQGSRRLM